MLRQTDNFKKEIKIKGLMYFHSDCKPIDEIDFNEDDSQFSFDFKDECEGMCGN